MSNRKSWLRNSTETPSQLTKMWRQFCLNHILTRQEQHIVETEKPLFQSKMKCDSTLILHIIQTKSNSTSTQKQNIHMNENHFAAK